MDSNTNGNMNHSTPTTPTAAPEPAQGWTYERRLAMFLLGKLALDGFLSDTVFNDGTEYLIDSTAQQISEGIEALCSDGDLQAVSNQADIGRMHQDNEGQS